MASTAFLELLDSPKWISRKIWVAEKSWNFHIMLLTLQTQVGQWIPTLSFLPEKVAFSTSIAPTSNISFLSHSGLNSPFVLVWSQGGNWINSVVSSTCGWIWEHAWPIGNLWKKNKIIDWVIKWIMSKECQLNFYQTLTFSSRGCDASYSAFCSSKFALLFGELWWLCSSLTLSNGLFLFSLFSSETMID